jgi:glutathionyl-hydroquinone reductase
MAMLVNGEWRDVTYDTSSTGGRFERPPSAFRNWVMQTARRGRPGPEVSLRSEVGITCMSAWRVPGRIAR